MGEINFSREKVIRYFMGKHSEDDATYIKEVFHNKEHEQELEHFLRRQWYEMLQDDTIDQEKNLDSVLYRIHYEINCKSPKSEYDGYIKRFLRWSSRIAAILFIPLAIFFGSQVLNSSNEKELAFVEIKAPAWTRVRFSLPDGTTGWLNSNSSIRYNGNFNFNRQVMLTGEAFFDVFSDKRRPFLVNTKDVTLRVLGTRFNVASYENEKNVEVVLEEGELIFNNKVMNKSFTMKPNELVIYDKERSDFYISEVEPYKYLSWTEGKLAFRNDPLDVIARRLERWYNIDIEFKGDISYDLRLRATFPDESLEEVLNMLMLSLQIDCSIVDRGFGVDNTFTKRKVIISTRTN